MSHPVLYHKGRDGSLRRWRVYTEGDTIYTEHGIVGGALVTASRRATPKNVGKKNATTGEQQAITEAAAMFKHQIDRKYSLTSEAAQDDVLLPMLAHPFEKREKGVTYPVHVQPKLDGVRALARWEGDKVVLISRQGKVWEATTHINVQLATVLPKGSVLDGELYLHGKPLQWITSRCKKKQEGTELIEYHVYDMPETAGDDSLPYSKRWWELAKVLTHYMEIAKVFIPNIVKVRTDRARTRDEVQSYHNMYVAQGYEGAIVRLPDGEYEWGHRSPSLLKVKAFEDAEFEIVGHTQGEGSEEGLVIWVCKNDTNDLTFETRPRGSHPERAKLFQHATDYYGQKLTVRFLGRNDSGLPHHAIGHAIRLEEDM